MSALPSVLVVGAVQLTVAEPVATCSTASENAGSEADAVPSDTEMMMFANVAMSVSAGVPESRPVAVLNVAQAGRFWMLNVSVLPSGSLALGWNEYGVSTLIDSSGVPEMVGARLAGADDLDGERGQRRGGGSVRHGNRDARRGADVRRGRAFPTGGRWSR